jgi:hypothetical protein
MSASMTRIFGLLLALCCACSAPGQTSSSVLVEGVPDYSGMYSFLKEGEFVQINMEEGGKVTGFVSRYGDLESDRGAFLDHFIKHGSFQAGRIAFTTEEVHGIWFEFKGTAARGEGNTANDEGYYLLKGTLTEHANDARGNPTARSRAVVFKSFPEDVSGAGRPTD